MTRSATTARTNIWRARSIRRQTKLKLLWAQIFPISPHGCESWALKKNDLKKYWALGIYTTSQDWLDREKDKPGCFGSRDQSANREDGVDRKSNSVLTDIHLPGQSGMHMTGTRGVEPSEAPRSVMATADFATHHHIQFDANLIITVTLHRTRRNCDKSIKSPAIF